ncbi:MAG TPA: hypothetical protein VME44_07230 [Streptosporangiaceae bacterium]|nr:hypothetical protein [Streptosporangiaceae bacterium]
MTDQCARPADRVGPLRPRPTGAAAQADQVDRLFLPFTRLDDRTGHARQSPSSHIAPPT